MRERLARLWVWVKDPDRVENTWIWKRVKQLEVMVIIVALAAFWLDYEARQEQRVVNAWTLIGAQQFDGDLCDEEEEANLGRKSAVETLLRAGVDLRGVQLERAYLPNIEFPGAGLRSADLGGAHLARADLEGATLASASLKCASIPIVNLMGANLMGPTWRGPVCKLPTWWGPIPRQSEEGRPGRGQSGRGQSEGDRSPRRQEPGLRVSNQSAHLGGSLPRRNTGLRRTHPSISRRTA
jgi:hypothetical protein